MQLPILSKREIEILKLLTHGLSSREIADKLMISYYTVRTHRKNILKKLDKKNTAEMISYTLLHNLI
jgi:DNA-binding CsgD family transcriptional regulator